MMKLVAALDPHKNSPIPEVSDLLNQVSVTEADFNRTAYKETLQLIYKKYIRGFFVKTFG